MMTRRFRLALPALLLPAALTAQTGYRRPPEPIASILEAAPLPLAVLSPDRRSMLLVERPASPSIADVAAPELRLAGDRWNPRTNGRSREATATGLQLVAVGGGTPRRIATPAGATLAHVQWSPDGTKVFFSVIEAAAIRPWMADVGTATAKPLASVALNATAGSPCRWLGARPAVICLTVPAARGAAPVEPTTPTGPIIQDAIAGKADRAATFQDLLKSPFDESLFTHYGTSQIVMLGMDGTSQPIGAAGLITDVTPSPNAEFLLVSSQRGPFSYVVPRQYFPTKTEVWSLSGSMVKSVNDRGLVENVPWGGDAVLPGPRNVSWRADAPATLAWVEALDGGTGTTKVALRDRVLTLAAPFTAAPTTHASLEFRARGITWARSNLAILNESWSKTRRSRTWAFDPSSPTTAPRLLFDRSAEDAYADPGQFLTTTTASGDRVLLTTPDGKSAFLRGDGASAEGDRPFLDSYDIATGKTTRLFRSAAPYYEDVVALLDPRADVVVTRRESKTEPPNYWRRALKARIAPIALTTFADPAPQFAGVTSEQITYSRKDGVQLSATMYLPAGYDKARDGKLPFFLWAYPREFRSAAAASQVQGSPHRFVRPTGYGGRHLQLLLQGYGVLDGPTMPIIGEGDKEPNDTYIAQLVASAQAAVDKIDALGVGDRERVAVGGHSYGGFMTANLLAHSKLFRAGIAESGAYNRTLTPFGFQAEDRTYWQAMEIYENMSPFNYADKLKTPILLIHGMADDNTGTYPIQSERFFAALKGNGGTVRYVQLPAEAHGYRAKETIGHTVWEFVTWMDTYVKPKKAAM
jgi:dipeptidyl aminopeptidase/acylaminoacyl peptidase